VSIKTLVATFEIINFWKSIKLTGHFFSNFGLCTESDPVWIFMATVIREMR
jgi:hypothetical protein